MSLLYLASPYSPIEARSEAMAKTIRESRYHSACRAAAYLMRAGHVVFCPIAHSHPIEQHFPSIEGGEFWKRQDEPYLMAATSLVVLELPGWTLSKGVAHEIAVAEERGIPISYMAPL